MTDIDLKKLRAMNEESCLYYCPRCGDAVPVYIRTITTEDRFGKTVEKEVHCLKCQAYGHKFGAFIQPLELPKGDITWKLGEWTGDTEL